LIHRSFFFSYICVFKIQSLSQALALDEAALARMNIRPQDRSRLRRACGDDFGALRLRALADVAPVENH
jgi:hypothetical protein